MKNKKHLQMAASFSVGLIFSLGLVLSGMVRPEKVIGFLDVVKDWDATLIFVMLGAIPVHFIAYRLIKNRQSPLFDVKFHLPTSRVIDKKLVLGAVLFGTGWGLGGFCPGPALTALVTLRLEVLVFVAMMFVGMGLYKLQNR